MAYISLLDMFDGGGAGASGSEFKGGPVSGLLNRMGVRPAGYAQRTASADVMPPRRPQAPMAVRPAPVSVESPNPPMSVTPLVYSGRGSVGMPYGVGGVNPVTPYGEAARFAGAATAQPSNVPEYDMQALIDKMMELQAPLYYSIAQDRGLTPEQSLALSRKFSGQVGF